MNDSTKNLVIVGALLTGMAALGYGVYYLFSLLKKTGDKAGDSIGDAIVDAFDLDKSDIVVSGRIALPDGRTVSIDAIAQGNGIDKNLMFTWQGVRYKLIGKSDSYGNRIAARA